MKTDINAEIISIGTEILLGELTDTNSVYIAQTLRDMGINLYMMVSVGDNRKRIADAIRSAMNRAQVVITCGGLGPTVDDVTRQAVADATDRELVFHEELLRQIAERFAGFKVQMTDNNRQQAYLPVGAQVIENPVGTAPAFMVEHEGGVVISLPGVPREMKFLMNERVVPYLQERYQGGIIQARVLKSAGIGESALDELIGRDLLENSNPTIGLAAHMGQIDIRITAKAQRGDDAQVMIAETERLVRERAGRFIYGVDGDTLEEVFVDLLTIHQARITVIQAGIGNGIVDALESVPGGDAVIVNPKVFADPSEMIAYYHMPDIGSLRDVTQQIAQQACEASGASAAIVAASKPEVVEGADNEEATVIAVYTPAHYRDRVYGFGAQSEFARTWGRSWLLSTAWRLLKEQYDAE